jgi:murE/murF fusion protein
MGRPCGLIGTLGQGLAGQSLQPFGLTMPDVLSLHRILAGLEREGASLVAMEATSIGLDQGRLDGVRPAVAVLTNLTRDHLDYHGSIEAYGRAKLRLFEQPGLACAVVNAADVLSVQALAAVGESCDAIAYGEPKLVLRHPRLRHLLAERIVERPEGLQIGVVGDFGRAELLLPLLGRFNAANALAVAGAWLALGCRFDDVIVALSRLKPVPGRLQQISRGDAPLAVIDYAHTPDALRNTLRALRPVARARGGRLICVFGAGGGRDRGKRPMMGAIAESEADQIVLTSDNPRDESPRAILAEIAAGMSALPSRIEPDRGLAIDHVIRAAHSTDVVLIAGKGHEAWQEIGPERLPFSDAERATQALEQRLADDPMSGFRLRAAFDSLTGACLYASGDLPLTAVVTDSRAIVPGSLFVALAGERFDGHDFMGTARDQGAGAVLFERWRAGIMPPAIAVADGRRALGELAYGWRQGFSLPLVAVTGANGKTTVKEMIASILRAAAGDRAVLASHGNHNNEIGVAQTLLRLRERHRLAVLELGMNHPGEMSWLARIAAPTIALVNNAQREHQEFIAGAEGSARENGQVIAALAAEGCAVFPVDDASHAPIWRALAGPRRVIGFGLAGSLEAGPTRPMVCALADARPEAFELVIGTERIQVRLAIAGAHNVRNALAAAACALAAGIDPGSIRTGLEAFRPVAGRLAEHRAANGARVLDDSYNANPDSVRAAIDVLAACEGLRLLALGDMGEVGEQGPHWHAEVGAYARERGIDALLALGQASRAAVAAYGAGAEHFESVETLSTRALELLRPDGVLLVKGSRFMRMERVVRALTGEGGH